MPPTQTALSAPPGALVIRAVLFDVDGTLYAQPPLRAAMACELAVTQAGQIGRGRPQAIRILRAFRRMREDLREGTTGSSIEREQYSVVSRLLQCSEADVRLVIHEWMHRRPIKWLRWLRRPGLLPLLDELGSRGIRCGVFSDYPVGEKLTALGVADRFDLALSAVDPEIAAFKPSPRGFLEACRRWRLPPSSVLYVGDRPDVDGAGAAAAGMRCALLGRRNARLANGWTVRNFEELRRVISANC